MFAIGDPRDLLEHLFEALVTPLTIKSEGLGWPEVFAGGHARCLFHRTLDAYA
jgi:hypothetical protein